MRLYSNRVIVSSVLTWGGVSCEHISQIQSTSASVLRAWSSCDAWMIGSSVCCTFVSCKLLSRSHCSKWLRLYLHMLLHTDHTLLHVTQVVPAHVITHCSHSAPRDSGCTCTRHYTLLTQCSRWLRLYLHMSLHTAHTVLQVTQVVPAYIITQCSHSAPGDSGCTCTRHYTLITHWLLHVTQVVPAHVITH